MTTPHHARTHAEWPASATARNSHCLGALALTSICEDRETEAAAWGTAAHQIAEPCLKNGVDASSFIDTIQKSGVFEFEVDEEMANCAQAHVDYVRGRMAEYKEETRDEADLWIEENFSLAKLNPPFQAGGTGDAILWFPRWRLLEIVDLKGGRGVVVEVVGNMQERSYAIGALLHFPQLNVRYVRTTIVQPRAYHRDGIIRSETFHVSDLIEWSATLLQRMREAKQAKDEFDALDGSRIKFDEWATKWLRAGKCDFCPAQGICPEFRRQALSATEKTVQTWFEEPTTDQPLTIPNAPALMSAEEIAHVLDGLEALEEWIRAVRSHALKTAEAGNKIPGWALYDKIGHRKWLGDEATTVKKLRDLKLTGDQIFVKKLASPAQIEKTLGAKRKNEIAGMFHAPKTGVNLAREDKTTREPTGSVVEKNFETVKEN
jgi:hypothetical protein